MNTIKILGILFCFGIIISFLVYRTLKLKNKQQKQEYELKYAIEEIAHQNKLQEQRLSISRDLHDNIGAQLTFIISSIETLKQAFNIKDEKINNKLTSISNFTKDTITELRDTIWAMNHSEIDFNEIRNRILNFVEKAENPPKISILLLREIRFWTTCIFRLLMG
jgi:signal transduction histidine kinase